MLPPSFKSPTSSSSRHYPFPALPAERVLPRGNLRPRPGRGPRVVPAPVLVLLAPGCLHHDSPGYGRTISEIIACFSRKAIFGYGFVAHFQASPSQFWVSWCAGHHLFVAGQSMYASMVFSFISFLVIPSPPRLKYLTGLRLPVRLRLLRYPDALRIWFY